MATSSDYHRHPLPPPPQQEQQFHQFQQYQQQQPAPQHYSQPSQQQSSPQAKPRTFSFHSDRSRRSGGSKTDFIETQAEKEARRIQGKTDPTLAINEAEPAAIAAMASESSYVPLRSMQHKDHFGNPIAEPDRSNPTRNRWERPLDTIRSFEAAIDGDYSRKSLRRSETDGPANWNRRSSTMFGNQPRTPLENNNYYNSRPPSFRAESSYFGGTTPGTARNSYYDTQGGGGNSYNRSYSPGPNRLGQSSRMYSDPQYQTYGREQNVYPYPHKDRSYETVTSAAASGNSDPAGYQTDPTSSDNSSVHRTSPAKRPEPVNDYGIGFSQSQSYQAPNFSVGPGRAGNHPLPPPPPKDPAHQARGPAIPRKQPSVLRRQPVPTHTEVPEKRKSWFSRRFSKS